MTPADHLERATELLELATAEIEAAKDGVPAYSLDALRFLRAEIKVTLRRLGNVVRVLRGASDGPRPAA